MSIKRQRAAAQVTTRLSQPADQPALTQLLTQPGLAAAAGLTVAGDPAGLAWALQTWRAAGQLWSVVVDHQVVGLVTAFPTGPAQREIGYLLAPAWWGRGIMTTAVGQVVAQLGDQDLVATSALTNQASQRILIHAGFHQVGATTTARHWSRPASQN